MSAHVHTPGIWCAESFGTEETLVGFLARMCGADMVLLVASVGELSQANRALVLQQDLGAGIIRFYELYRSDPIALLLQVRHRLEN